MFRLGYNTNGLAHHRPLESLRLLSELGYEGMALTPDVGQLDPFVYDPVAVGELRELAEELGMQLAVETGARYVLDPRQKHYPTLLEQLGVERQRRVDFLRRSVDLAQDLGAKVVSLWAGCAPEGVVGDRDGAGEECEPLWERLLEGVGLVLEHARGSAVDVAFEPEPGMFLERPRGYTELKRRLGASGADLRLCLDVGHLLCTGDLPVAEVIRAYADELAQVHLDDIKDGVHDHRMFGTGDLDLRETLHALREVGYQGMAAVELSRDSHRGPAAAAEAMEHLLCALES